MACDVLRHGGYIMRVLVAVLVVSASLILCATDAFTCGDKFLVVGRGIRYQRAAVYPASILLYSQDVKVSKELQSSLQKSGHKIQTVADDSTLFSNLKATKYDLVLVSLKDVARLESNVITTTYKPAVLPVIYDAKGNELEAAKKEHQCVLKYSKKNKNAVAVIDEVMEAKKKGKPQICKWTK